MVRDVHVWKETLICGMSAVHIQGVGSHCWRGLRRVKYRTVYMNGALYVLQESVYMEGVLYMWKEFCTYGKSRVNMWKESCIYGKSSVHMEGVLYIWKEFCTCEKSTIHMVHARKSCLPL